MKTEEAVPPRNKEKFFEEQERQQRAIDYYDTKGNYAYSTTIPEPWELK